MYVVFNKLLQETKYNKNIIQINRRSNKSDAKLKSESFNFKIMNNEDKNKILFMIAFSLFFH